MIEHLESEPAARAAVDRFARDGRERRAWLTRTVKFKDLGDARMRRQIVRWIGREYHEPTPAIVETLNSALGDHDWEVRVSAMIVSARVRAKSLRGAVRETILPSANQHGLSERDIRVLVATRIIASESLASANPDDMDRAQVILRQLSDAPRHLVRSVLGMPVEQRDAAWLTLYALATPNELAEPLPDPLPPGLTLHDQRVWLSGIIEMCWVSPQAHLVGGDHLQSEQPSKPLDLREHTPAGGFFIARRPLSAAAALQLGLGPFPPLPLSDASLAARLTEMPDPPLALTCEEALSLCEHISTRTGASDGGRARMRRAWHGRPPVFVGKRAGEGGHRGALAARHRALPLADRPVDGIARRSACPARDGRPALAALRGPGGVAGGEWAEACSSEVTAPPYPVRLT
jgi:hypothetical protein